MPTPPVTPAFEVPAANVAVPAGYTTNSFSIWLKSSSKSSRTSYCHPFSKSKKMYLPTSFCYDCAAAAAAAEEAACCCELDVFEAAALALALIVASDSDGPWLITP